MVRLAVVNPVRVLQERIPDLSAARKFIFTPLARVILPAAVFATVFAISAAFAGSAIPIYTASARIWVQPFHFAVASKSDDAANGDDNTPFNTGPNALVTASEIMHSEAVASIAHDILAKQMGDKAPSTEFIKSSIHDNIVVVQGDRTDLLEAKYMDSNKDVALQILDAVVKAFFEENNRQTTNPLQQSKAKLETQLKMAKDQYAKSKLKVKQFQDTTNMLNLEKDADVLSSQKTDVERELVKIQNEITALRGKLQYDEKQLGFGPEDIKSFQKLSSDEVMEGLRKSVAETQVKLVDLRSKYQDEHPKIKRLKAQLEESKNEMNDRYTQLLGSSDHRIEVVAKGEAQSSLVSDMITSNTSLVALQATERSLNATLSRLRSKISALPGQVRELADIHRADDLATGSLTSIERALQRVTLDESTAVGSKNLQIVDAPSITGSSTPSTWTVGAALSFVLSLITAGLQFFLAPKFISARKLDNLAPGKVVGFIPPLKGDALGFSLSGDRLRRALGDWVSSSNVVPIVVTSSDKNDGKSTVTYTLAESLADAGLKVLLIDADCKHPTLHTYAGISASPGLVQFLSNTGVDSVRTMNAVKTGLTIIPAGGVTEVPVLKHPRFASLLSEVGQAFDAVLIDSTDCGDGLESLALPDVDCRLLVVTRLGQSSVNRVGNVITQLQMISKLDWAIVVNGAKQGDVKLLRQQMTAPLPAVQTTSSASGDSLVANW